MKVIKYETSCVRGGLPGNHPCSPKETRYGTLRRCGPAHHLTEVGRGVAEKIYERHCFFTEQLIAAGVDPKTAEADACRIEHVISNESFQKLKEALEDEEEGGGFGSDYPAHL